MSEILLYYRRPDPTTWVYLSSFLTIGLFFVFHRFWSIRNLDLFLLILLAPGLLIVHEGYRRQLVESESIGEQTLPESSPDNLDVLPPPPDDPPGEVEVGLPPASLVPPATNTPSGEGSLLDTSESAEGTTGDPVVPSPQDFSVLVNVQADALDVPGSSSSPPSALAPESLAPSSFAPQTEPAETVESNESTVNAETLNADPVNVDTPESMTADSANESSPERFQAVRRFGFVYLFVVEALLLIRLMLDPLMVRRPLLDPNLTSGGLTFIGISMFVFMMANVVTSDSRIQVAQGPALGPGYALMNMLPAIPTRPVSDAPGGVSPPDASELTAPSEENAELIASQKNLTRIAKTLAIAAQLSIIIGIVLVGNRHFGNLRAGVGCATLYLLLPYTAQMTGRVDHAVPAALLLWAVLSYRRPMCAGIFLGLAAGLVYYPLFLLPLWFSFYWQRGARPFTVGVVAMLIILVVALSLDRSASLGEHLQRMFGLLNPNKPASELRGFWSLGIETIWRLPVIVAFLILCVFFAIWPAQKNLATLMSGSAAVMMAAQFWHGYGGGLYIAWFLPLLLLTIFRPNLQDRIATKMVVGDRKRAVSPASPRRSSAAATRFAQPN